jgi:subtilisin family serine protease
MKTHLARSLRWPRQEAVLRLVVVVLSGLVLSGSAALRAGPEEPPPAIQPSRPQWQFEAEQQRSKLLARMGADRWQATGVRGQGVKIAVLDTGFRGYHSHLGKALPASVLAHSFRTDGNLEAKDNQHGILCAEVIHAIAPDAELIFADWDIEHPETFLAAVRWARQQGARIVSCSIVMPNWSDGEGQGEVHQKLAQLLGSGAVPGDMLCFASAGNTTERHWTGAFHDGGDGFHEWKPGQKDNRVSPWGKERCSVELYWKPGADYDLFVHDADTGRPVGVAHTDHNHGDRSSAVVYFQPEPGHNYRARVRLVHGQPAVFHLCTMESTLEYTVNKGSVCFPADGPSVIAMGAEDGDGHKVWYSACGPNSPRPKPDFVATIPFPSLWRERTFGGTSAAAPQGSAQAALWLSRHPNWTANQVRAAMKASAVDLGPPGHDLETGYGLIHLPHE